MFRRKTAVKATIDTLIGASSHIEGNVLFQGGLRIDGHVRGNVIASGDKPGLLIIGEHARVDGDVVAAHLIVNGALDGTAIVQGMIELQPKARVRGELRYKAIEIHRGAVVEAALSIIEADGSRPGLKLASSNDAQPVASHGSSTRSLSVSG